jgi:[ribosomal protein S5]-alanine N-acetyltransferase
MIQIESERLKLIPLDYQLLSIWDSEGRHSMEKKLGLAPSSWEVDEFYEAETKDAIQNFWMPKTKENPDQFYWFTNWEIVLTKKNISIGGIGFVGSPYLGTTSIGYLIDNKFQRNGFATEALACLLEWAFLDPSLKTVLADTPKQNLASQKVLQKNSFLKTGEGIAEHTKTLEVFNWVKKRPLQ